MYVFIASLSNNKIVNELSAKLRYFFTWNTKPHDQNETKSLWQKWCITHYHDYVLE